MTTISWKASIGWALVLTMMAASPVMAEETDDPIESANRAVFDGNQFIDRHVLKPVAGGYRETLPGGMQRAISNMLSNLREPSIAVNDLLQGNPARSLATLWRFGVNSTVGALGIFDVAADYGFERHHADFGQTLGVWGLGTGPYLTLPLLGPSNLRDATGTVVNAILNPLPLGPAAPAVTVGQAMDQRIQASDALEQMERSSVDFYASLRSAYLQQRQALVADGKKPGSYGLEPAAPALDLDETLPEVSATELKVVIPGLPTPAAKPAPEPDLAMILNPTPPQDSR
jgi:phospholipid-binding lipoprotein MlaA